MTTTSAALRFHQRNRAYYDDLERLHQLLVVCLLYSQFYYQISFKNQ